MSRVICFRDGIHYVDYTVVIGRIEDFRKLVHKKYPEFHIGDKTAFHLYAVTGNKREAFIYLNRLDVPCLAHEAVHAAVSVIDDIGSKVTKETDEHIAYYVQWLVGTVWHHFKPNGFLNKRKKKR